MTTPFRGLVNMDVRESVADRAPYEQTKAPAGAPNVVYIVLDDVGFAGLGCYGGMIDTPNIDKIAARGVRYNEWHTTALCSPTRSCLLTGRNHTTNGMACITEGAAGFPNGNGHIPPQCATLAEVLAEKGIQDRRRRQVAPDRRGRDEHGLDQGETGRWVAGSNASTASSARKPTSGTRT